MEEVRFTPTVQAVASQLGGEPVTASRLCEAVLGRHPEYGEGAAGSRAVAWPARGLRKPVDGWLGSIGELFQPGTHEPLHGRAVVIGAALIDRFAGAALVEAGLFRSIAGDLEPPVLGSLTDHGRELLGRIPLALSASGLGPATVLTVPDDGLSGLLSLTRVAVAADGTVVGLVPGIGVFAQRTATGPAELVRKIQGRPGGRGGAVAAPVETSALVDWLAREDPGELAGTPDGRVRLVRTPGRQVEVRVGGETVAQLEAGADDVAGSLDALGEVAAVRDAVGTVHVRRIAEAVPWQEVRVPGPPIGLALDPEGARLAVATSAGAAVVDLPGGVRAELSTDQPNDLAWSPDGSLLAVAADDGWLTLWHAGTGAVVARVVAPQGLAQPLLSVTFSPDGRWVVAGTHGAALGWPVALPRRRVVADYSADLAVAGRDLVGIDADAQALATLIATKSLAPPLSVAVFGDWGAGKSFFMRRLRDEVAGISRDARASGEAQRDIEFFKYVAQVEFNAWQYVEGNLWASLVEHILSNLYVDFERPPAEEAKAARQRQERLLESEEQALVAATREVQDVRGALAALENAIGELKHTHDEGVNALRDAAQRDALAAVLDQETAAEVESALAPLGVPVVSAAARDLSAAVASGRRELDRWAPALRAVDGTGDATARALRRRFALAAVAGPLTALAVGFLTWAVGAEGIAAFSGVASGAAAGAGALAEWIRRQAKWSAELRAKVDEASAKVEAEIDGARRRHEAQVASLREQLAALNAELAAKVAAEEQVRARVEALQAAQRTTSSELLARYIQDRVASEDYRKHLGLPALVRRDFERMSRMIGDSIEELASNEDPEAERRKEEGRLDRIVLYIDDLDRCPPRQVVEVLEAVHLLLAFPLFVVVVGVDARWVLRSLESHYSELLGGDGEGQKPAATPLDYVEKIFQVPYQLQPISVDATRRMLAGLLGPAAADEGDAGRRSEAGARPVGEPSGEASGEAGDGDGDDGGTVGAGGEGSDAEGPLRRSPLRDLTPDGLIVKRREHEAMEELAPLVGTTPRTVKRFVNLYRILKVRALTRGDAFLGDRPNGGDYEVTQLLLAVSTGLPGLAPRIFDAVDASHHQEVGGVLEEVLGGGADGSEAERSEAARLRAWLASPLAQRWRAFATSRCTRRLADVRRFSFLGAAPGATAPAAPAAK